MSDLIDRKKALDAIQQRADRVDSVYSAFWDGLIIAQDIVKNLPSAEPERKKGKWSNYKDEHCCSVCKCVVISECWDDDIRYDYCPYCGAEMSRGEHDESD